MAIDFLGLQPLIERAARDAHKTYPEFHDMDDTIQTLWVWIYENTNTVEDIIRDDYDRSTDNKALYNLLMKAARGYLNKEDADWHHYTKDDSYFYTTDLIEEILEVVFKHEEWQSFATYYDMMPKGKTDPAYAGNNIASYVDVSRAVKLLSDEHYNAVVWRFKYNYTYQMIGEELGLTRQGAQRRVDAAVNAIQRELGRKDLADLREIPAEHERPHGEGAQIRSDRYYEG